MGAFKKLLEEIAFEQGKKDILDPEVVKEAEKIFEEEKRQFFNQELDRD